MDVRIFLYGCDDTTYIDTDVTAEEYDFDIGTHATKQG